MDKITKLSQAIRLGSTFRPQCERHLYHHGKQASCALGAAAEAVGLVDWDDWTDCIIGPRPEAVTAAQGALEKRFPELAGMIIGEPPVTPWFGGTDLLRTIVYLNDVAHWSRERISDWLESKGL